MKNVQTKIEWVYQVLQTTYGENPLIPRREPMHELISTMLSHRTTEANEAQAYNQMRERFGSWQAIRDADVDDLAEAIRPANFASAKAPKIKEVLRLIIAERGQATIDFLAEYSVDEGLAWLTNLPGVGPKTASLVLLFCFAKPVLPVDTHVYRVSQRLGLIDAKINANKAHDQLLKLLPDDTYMLYNYHINMLRHGQRICTWSKPKCQKCPLKLKCDYYQSQQPTESRQS